MGNKCLRRAFSLFLLLLLSIEMAVKAKTETKIPVKVGVILDYNEMGKVWLSCIKTSISEFYASVGRHYKTRLLLNFRDSKSDDVGATEAAMDLIKNVEVQAIIGPAKSTQANFLIKLGEKAKVPIISFSATSPALSSTQTPYFFRATQSDKTQADAIATTIEASGFKEAVPVYIDNEYGAGVIHYLCNSLAAVDIHVPYRSAISPAATDDQILDELYKLKMLQNKVFIVHMYPSLGIRIFDKAKQVGMMGEDYVWILTDGMTIFLDSSPESLIFDALHGVVLGVKPHIPKTKEIEKFGVRWKRKFQEENPDVTNAELNVYGLWAYDAITAVAIAVEKTASTTGFSFQKTRVCSNPATDLETIGVSESGPELAQALSSTSFKGLIGDFAFVNQQLQPSGFQIDNINGAGQRWTEIWMPTKGFSRKLNSLTSMTKSNQPKYTCVPKNAELESDNWLRIGVPRKEGFAEFVNVARDPVSGKTNVSGFCIDIFDAAMKALPGDHRLPYCYVPFNKHYNRSGYYDELVNQVFLGRYNIVVGDVTIIARRANHVDYSMPYMEYGPLEMIVAYNKSDLSWVLFKPLTTSLWLAFICFFFFTGFVVWILERGQNEEFQGSISSQFGISFWFAFSILVFAHRERITNNLTRVVVLMSCFVVLLLTQSYGAALSSYLTLQQLQPDVDDVKALITTNAVVGYQDGSYVREILGKWGFKQENLKSYTSAQECHQLLSNYGTEMGGIAAAFDEAPFANLILKLYGSKYVIVRPKLASYLFQPTGFGFVFRRGSPLARKVSRQILSLTENNSIRDYQDKWLGNQTDYSADSSSNNGPVRLGPESFWVLFLIVGIVSALALLIHGVKSAYKCKNGESTNGGVDSDSDSDDENVSVKAPSTPPPSSSPDNSIHGNHQSPFSPESNADHQNPNGQTPHQGLDLNIELTSIC